MKKYPFETRHFEYAADTFTPVGIYQKVRKLFPGSFLLESSDFESLENSFTYLCFNPIAEFSAGYETTVLNFPDQTLELATKQVNIAEELFKFSQQFSTETASFPFATNGLFGYTSYDAIPFFEDIQFKTPNRNFVPVHYRLFRYVLVFSHFHSKLHVFEHLLPGQTSEWNKHSSLLTSPLEQAGKFTCQGSEHANLTDERFLEMIDAGIRHCKRGDVFQVVMSREFSQEYSGDDFQVYRALRSINPSPYMFYFDLGETKIFGSSPEAQLLIKNHKAIINPIAGTFKRTGQTEKDQELATQLLNDPKENAEHTMLVDLARNDLSRTGNLVTVEKLKQIEFYSHVIHLVSRVSAQLPADYNPIQVLGESYPAGTLSGAPKHRAMQIIDEQEPDNRGFYGGAVGMLGLHGEVNHAIFIRSFVSQNQQLHFRAGCGVVVKSNRESELQEVHNKLSALRKALQVAQDF